MIMPYLERHRQLLFPMAILSDAQENIRDMHNADCEAHPVTITG